jgi:hypothetical protein
VELDLFTKDRRHPCWPLRPYSSFRGHKNRERGDNSGAGVALLTAESIAELLQARRVAPGRYQARCPAHDDRNPSLSITQGERGVLVRCWSQGCTVEQIVRALGIRVSDLFSDAPPTPEQRQQAAEAKTIRDAESRAARAVDRERRERIFKLDRLTSTLAARLVRRPDDDKLAELFHAVCDRLHDAEMAAYPDPKDGPTRLPEPSALPGWIGDALAEIEQNLAK